MNNHLQNHSSKPKSQNGFAMFMSIVLLLMAMVLGLASMRATTTEQKITTNYLDQQLAFQNAESGLRVAAQFLKLNSSSQTIRDCSTKISSICPSNPFADQNLSVGDLLTVPDSTFKASSQQAGQPQYVIEYLGKYPPAGTADSPLTANSQQTDHSVGFGGTDPNALARHFYRITARSSAPQPTNPRAVVTLQAIVSQ